MDDRVTNVLASRIEAEMQERRQQANNNAQVFNTLKNEIAQLKKELRNVGLLMTGVENLSERLTVVENKLNR